MKSSMLLKVLLLSTLVMSCAETKKDAGNNSPQNQQAIGAPDAGSAVVVAACRAFDFDVDAPLGADLMTVAELEVLPMGSRGVVVTTIRGTEPVTLPVTLVGFYSLFVGFGMPIPIIILETDPCDPRWAEWGGAAAGMSGSPVILTEGRLAGALSYTFGTRLQAPYIFGATPAEVMARGAESGTSWITHTDIMPMPTDGLQPVGVVMGWNSGRVQPDLIEALNVPETVQVVLGLGGVESGLLGACREVGESASPDCDVPNFRAGSSIAIPVVMGDLISSTAIGTVTYLNENGIMAFGHPFFGTGPTSLGYTGAEIYGIQGNPLSGASKFGVPKGRFLGVIKEDRASGISGVPGEQPALVRINSIIADPAGVTKEFRHTIQAGLPKNIIVYSSLDAVISGYWGSLDYMTGGSVRYNTRTTFSGSDTVFETIGRGWDDEDFSMAVLYGMGWSGGMYDSWYYPINSLLGRFSEHHITSVTLNGRWSADKEVLEVTGFKADPPLPEIRDGGGSYPEVRPGDVISVVVTTIDRSDITNEPTTHLVAFTIPEDAISGIGRIALSKTSLLPAPEVVPDPNAGTFEAAVRKLNLEAAKDELSELYVGMYGPTESSETGEKGGGSELPEENMSYSHEELLMALDTIVVFAPELVTSIKFVVVRLDETSDAGSCDGSSCGSPGIDAGSRDAGTGRDAGVGRDAQ
ncbi:MAG: hypothetical protein WCJ29_04590 [bacterium]